jgi:hypothetical protein
MNGAVFERSGERGTPSDLWWGVVGDLQETGSTP